MSGIRIRHPHLRDVNFVVEDPNRPYREPYACPKCNVVHPNKAYHLALDSHGEQVISHDIYERLALIPGLPLVKVGKERRPKDQALVVGLGNATAPDKLPKRVHEALRWSRHAEALPVVHNT